MIPTCQSGSSRHAEYTSRLRNFDSMTGSGSLPAEPNLGGNDHKGSILWQPKIAGDLAQAAVVEDSALK